jgi:hypothetical protein
MGAILAIFFPIIPQDFILAGKTGKLPEAGGSIFQYFFQQVDK